MTGTQNIVARDAVFLSPGFSYTATSGHTFDASINSQLHPPAYSTGSNIIDPDTRSLNTALPVGTLPGVFNVNNVGAATYQIPIFTSPGTAGMQPQISIVYNSLSDDGLLGKGWDIAGLSAIRRVPRTFYNDTIRVGVMLESSDRFALDSNRLVLTSGTYGAENSEYKTELETFVLVTAKNTAGNGPEWFEVKTKDGRTLEYGNTADSRVEAYGSQTVYMWRLNMVKDQNGNYINFQYNKIKGESYIKTIAYTGNLGTQLVPYDTIKFNYSTRSDTNSYFVGGSRIPNTALLTSIRMETEGNELVREYQFRYVSDFYTHLNEIVEYGSDHKYLNSTAIGWGTSTTEFSNNDVFNNGRKNKFYQGDFNGDGRTDFIITEDKTSFTTSDQWSLYLATTDGTSFTHIADGNLNSNFKGFVVVDADGNGKDDVLWRFRETVNYKYNPHPCEEGESSVQSSGNSMQTDQVQPPTSQDTCWDVASYEQEVFKYYYINSSGLARGSSSYDLVFPNAPADISLMPVDLDGNGKVDYLVLTSSKNIYNIRGVTWNSSPDFNSPDDVRILDFDGDGKKEILVIKNNNSYIYQYNSSGGIFDTIYSSSSFPTNNDRIFLGDFNGDKKTDILSWRSGSGWSLKFSTGTSFVASANTPALINVDPNASITDNNYYISDFNGDGKDDILEAFVSGSASHLDVYYSQGGGIFEKEENSYSKSSINQDYFNIGDFNGDGKKDLFYYDYTQATDSVNICFFHKDELKHFVSSIANGLNYKTQITYDRLNSGSSFYSANNSAAFPVYDYNSAYYAVSEVHTDDGLGNTIPYVYIWEGATIHRQGKGFLGFTKKTQTDDYRKYQSIKIFEQNAQFYYFSLSKEIDKLATPYVDTLNIVTYTNDVTNFGGKRIFPYTVQSIAANQQLQTTITTSYNFDNYGNNIKTKTIYRNDEMGYGVEAIKSSTNLYSQYGNYGIPNKLIKTTDSSTYTNESSYARIRTFTYDNNGNLLTETNDSSKAKAVTTTFSSFNSFGLPLQTTISAPGLTSRSTTVEYDTKGRFITKVIDPTGTYSTKTYFPGTGNVNTETSIDGLTTTYYHDGFGRLTETVTPQSNHIYTSYQWESYTSLYSVLTHATDKPFVKSYYDLLGREVRSETENPRGIVHQDKGYNSAGQLASQSWPYLEYTDNLKWTYFMYDEFGRLKKDSTSRSYTNYGYSGKMTGSQKWIGSDEFYVKSSQTNSLGNVIKSIESNSTVNNTYRSNGQVKQMSADGTIVTFYYDEYGRQDSVINPNSGKTTYQYNAFGELSSQTDAKNKTFTFQYDNLGRITTRTGTDGNTSYTYVQNGYGKEQIQSITSPNGVSQSYTYDTYGRITQLTESILGDQSFSTTYGYDIWNNNTSVTYPSGISITNVYINGYLNEIKKSDGTSIWKLDSINALGQPVKFTLANSSNFTTNFDYDNFGNLIGKKYFSTRPQTYTFDTLRGNMLTRSYKPSGSGVKTETFEYDVQNRLILSTVNGLSSDTVSYDSRGNIVYKTGLGTYRYNSSKVNRLDSINVKTSYSSLPFENITYNDYNLTATLKQDHDTLQFLYGPDNQRIKTILIENRDTIKTKYFSLNYEKEVKSSGVRQLHYIYSPFGLVAVIIRQGSTDSLYYTETDHMGSIIGLMRPNGTYAEKYSYDAWGRIRNPTDWSYDNVPAPTLIDRGFTGHEHLDKFGLINMNGRLYDPEIGRFVSVDPVIQFPENSQSFNGYGYCLNNPLKYSDPSGMLVAPPDMDMGPIDQYFGWMTDVAGSWHMSGGGGYGLPGQGRNGKGLNGVYWDWESFTYRSTSHYEEVSGPIFNRTDFEKTYSLQIVYGQKQSISGFQYFSTPTLPNGNVISRTVPILFSIKDQNFAFNLLWEASCFGDSEFLENNAFLTNMGVLILPNYNNTASKCSFNYLPVCGLNDNYFVTYNNQSLLILGTFHTHPGGSEYDWINGWDMQYLIQYGPVFVLSDFNLWVGYANNGKQYAEPIVSNSVFLSNPGIYNYVKHIPGWNR